MLLQLWPRPQMNESKLRNQKKENKNSVKCLTGIEELTDGSTVPLQLYRAEERFSCGSLLLFSFSIMQQTADRHSERSACEHSQMFASVGGEEQKIFQV